MVIALACIVVLGFTPLLKVATDLINGKTGVCPGPDLRLRPLKLIRKLIKKFLNCNFDLYSFFNVVELFGTMVAESAPRGGNFVGNYVHQVSSLLCHQEVKPHLLTRKESFQNTMTRGDELLKDGKALSKTTADGNKLYLCNVEAACCFDSDSLSGLARHVTVAHSKSKSQKRPLTAPGPGKPGKNPRGEDVLDESLLRVTADMNETDFESQDFGNVETPAKPFALSGPSANSTQACPMDYGQMVDSSATIVPEIVSPDKEFRRVPTEEENIKLFENSTYFYGDGSVDLTQGMVEEPAPEDDPDRQDLRRNHPYLYEDGSLESQENPRICSVCQISVPSNYGLHILEHVNMISYMPGYWKDRYPTCLTATLDQNTTRREMSHMIAELRDFMAKYEIYFQESEDRNNGRKTSIQLLMERISSLKQKITQELEKPEEDDKATLLTTIADLEGAVAKLELEKTSLQAEKQRERQHYLSKLQLASQAKLDAKKSATSITNAANKSLKESEAVKLELTELKRKVETAETKLVHYAKKHTELEKANEENLRQRVAVEELYEQVKHQYEWLLQGDPNAEPEDSAEQVESEPQLERINGEYIVPYDEEIDGKVGNNMSTAKKTKNGANKNGNRNLEERCMYNDQAKGCQDEECPYAHPTVLCKHFLKDDKSCKKPRFTCLFSHSKQLRHETRMGSKQNSKQKPAGKPARAPGKSDDNTVKVTDCRNWVMGNCLSAKPGQQRCYNGMHAPDRKGQGLQDENFQQGAGNKPDRGPGFTRSQFPQGRGKGRGSKQQQRR